MSDQYSMQLLLTALLILGCILRLLRRSLCLHQADAAVSAGAVLLGSGLFSAAFCFIITRFAGAEMLLPAWLLLALSGVAAASVQQLSRIGGVRSRLVASSLLALWGIAVMLLTLLTRRSSDTQVLMHWGTLQAALTGGHSEARQDVLLNLLLFLPLGMLLPRADTACFSWLSVLSAALVFTCAIEGLQLIFRLGQADVTDLTANVLGALGGWLLQRIRPRAAH